MQLPPEGKSGSSAGPPPFVSRGGVRPAGFPAPGGCEGPGEAPARLMFLGALGTWKACAPLPAFPVGSPIATGRTRDEISDQRFASWLVVQREKNLRQDGCKSSELFIAT